MSAYPRNALSRNAELWRLWAKGFSLEQIGQALGKPAASIYMAAASCGGIAPRERHRGAKTLSLVEREEISRGLAAGLSIRRMAGQMGRAPSTVSREIARNGGGERLPSEGCG
jgi:DNA-binding CsgD family transcriptional regulator